MKCPQLILWKCGLVRRCCIDKHFMSMKQKHMVLLLPVKDDCFATPVFDGYYAHDNMKSLFLVVSVCLI